MTGVRRATVVGGGNCCGQCYSTRRRMSTPKERRFRIGFLRWEMWFAQMRNIREEVAGTDGVGPGPALLRRPYRAVFESARVDDDAR